MVLNNKKNIKSNSSIPIRNENDSKKHRLVDNSSLSGNNNANLNSHEYNQNNDTSSTIVKIDHANDLVTNTKNAGECKFKFFEDPKKYKKISNRFIPAYKDLFITTIADETILYNFHRMRIGRTSKTNEINLLSKLFKSDPDVANLIPLNKYSTNPLISNKLIGRLISLLNIIKDNKSKFKNMSIQDQLCIGNILIDKGFNYSQVNDYFANFNKKNLELPLDLPNQSQDINKNKISTLNELIKIETDELKSDTDTDVEELLLKNKFKYANFKKFEISGKDVKYLISLISIAPKIKKLLTTIDRLQK